MKDLKYKIALVCFPIFFIVLAIGVIYLENTDKLSLLGIVIGLPLVEYGLYKEMKGGK